MNRNANASKKQWRRIADSRVRHVWKTTCSCAARGGAMLGGEVALVTNPVRVAPTFYEASGTPVCPECGADLAYSHTEIRRSCSWNRRG